MNFNNYAKQILLTLSLSLVFSCSVWSQEGFQVELGQFFEQGYGGASDEEAMDLIEFYNNPSDPKEYFIAGWTEDSGEDMYMPFDEGGEPTGGEESEGSLKNVSTWHADRIGAEQSHNIYGTLDHDEIATSVVQLNEEITVMAVHQSTAYERDGVKTGDKLWVLAVDVNGNPAWTYEYPLSGDEQEGIAPSDIIVDDSGNLVVLANHLIGETVHIETIKLDSAGNEIWQSADYAPNGGGWAFSLAEHGEGYITMVSSDDVDGPFLVQFGYNGQLQVTQGYNLDDSYVYGFDIDTLSGNIYGAGYTVGAESDTDAMVLEIDDSYSYQDTFQYGKFGMERFRDIVATGDGFIAGGVRTNAGEGGVDVTIFHLDASLQSFREEELGGSTDERFNRLMLGGDHLAAWFAGHNVEYEVEESGNAYIGGVVTSVYSLFFGNNNCKVPRVMKVNRLLEKGKFSLEELKNWGDIIVKADDLNINLMLLYDIDRLFEELDKPNPHTKAVEAGASLKQFMNDAAYHHINIGIIVGPDFDKADVVSNWLGATTNALNSFNYNNAGKAGFIMLEHEFWNPDRGDMRVLSPGDYNHPDNPTQTGIHNPYISSSFTKNDREAYYYQLTEDHKDLLNYLENKRDNSANTWKLYDWNYWYFNNHYTKRGLMINQSQGSGTTYYSNFDFSANSGTTETIEDHMARIANMAKMNSDGIVLGFYRPTNWATDYDLVSHSPFSERIPYIMRDNPNDQAEIIPAFTNERHTATSNLDPCFTDLGNGVGDWFQNDLQNNTPKKAEEEFLDQYNTDFLSLVNNTSSGVLNCSTCSTKVFFSAVSWYRYTCFKGFSFTGSTDRADCTPNANISVDHSTVEEKTSLEVYPNPAMNSVFVTVGDDVENIEYTIYDIRGGKISEGVYQDEIDLDELSKGVYIIHLTADDNESTVNSRVKIIKQ